MAVNIQIVKRALTDPSAWFLLLANIFTIFFALKDGWNVITIFWTYWFQSVIIGFFHVARILRVKTPSLFMTGNKVTKALGFAIHYGFFHFVYLLVLLSGIFNIASSGSQPVAVKHILLGAAVFFANHCFSFFYNKPTDVQQYTSSRLISRPYIRIIPMHITLILGAALGKAALPLFLALKIFCDLVLHVQEHSMSEVKDGVVNKL
jgi:hypothetical protein